MGGGGPRGQAAPAFRLCKAGRLRTWSAGPWPCAPSPGQTPPPCCPAAAPPCSNLCDLITCPPNATATTGCSVPISRERAAPAAPHPRRPPAECRSRAALLRRDTAACAGRQPCRGPRPARSPASHAALRPRAVDAYCPPLSCSLHTALPQCCAPSTCTSWRCWPTSGLSSRASRAAGATSTVSRSPSSSPAWWQATVRRRSTASRCLVGRVL